MTVGDFLLRRLREAGIGHMFGVPSDFNLELLQQVEDGGYRSFLVKTVADLEEALGAPNDRLVFVESVMDPYDAPDAVIHSSNNGAELDYGPRGPQHRGNAQLLPRS
jgi:TPP-dependent 2-oxoacid decarboxylase